MGDAKNVQPDELPFKKGIGLTFKFLVAISLLIIMIMSLVAVVVRTQVRQTLMTQMRIKGLALTKGLATNGAEALASGDRLLIAELVDKAVKQEEGILQAILVDNEEKIIVHSNFDKEGQSYLVENGLLYFKNEQIEITRFYFNGRECFDFAAPMELETKMKGERINFGKAHLIYSLHAIQRVSTETLQMIGMITIVFLIIGLLVTLVLASGFVRSIKKMASAVTILGKGTFDPLLEIRSNDELGELAWDLNRLGQNLNAVQMELIAKEKRNKETEIIDKMQSALIQQRTPHVKGYSFGMLYKAGDEEANGDYIDFIEYDKKHVAMIVADVSERGISGGLAMIQVRSIVRSRAMDSFSPAKVLTETNRQLYKDMQANVFVTMSYMVLDKTKRTITLSSAGHLAAMVYRKKTNTCSFEKPVGIAIGIADDKAFDLVLTERKLKLDYGDAILLYTNGVVEARNEAEKTFGVERLVSVFVKQARFPAQTILSGIAKALDAFMGTVHQQDDRAMILVKVEEEKSHE